jgi:NAD(P)-dependent dehydrogenase (short-subunit alcohol dehydrogenase family)
MRYLKPGTAILVTGATGGIGFEVARHAAEDGAIVGVHGSRQESVDAAMAKIREELPDARLVGLPANFHDESTIASMVDRFASEAGKLDALVHCAITGAAGTQGLFRNTTPEAYGKNAALVMGTFQQLSFAAYQHMMKQEEGGTIVAYISDAARFPAAHQTMLGSVFGGIITFVRNLGFEGARDKVRAHVISPSYVKETPVFERFGAGGRGETAEKKAGLGLPTPKDLAPLTLFLCGPDATKMTGQVLSVNGGINT